MLVIEKISHSKNGFIDHKQKHDDEEDLDYASKIPIINELQPELTSADQHLLDELSPQLIQQHHTLHNILKFTPAVNNNVTKQQLLDVENSTWLFPTSPPESNVPNNLLNDYDQHYVDTEQRPQNFIRGTSIEHRFEEYPKLRRLLELKREVIHNRNTPPAYLKCDLHSTDLKLVLDMKFDVIVINPPLQEYYRRAPAVNKENERSYWTWKDIMELKIEDLSANPSFIFLWVGSAEGLENGRACLAKWNYRRCEDIVWLKTNRLVSKESEYYEGMARFKHTKEHCLMGIKGTVRRATDGHFIHANCDTDVIVSEQLPLGDNSKPEEIYHIAENFCLGRRRLELFGDDRSIRPGWVTVGPELTSSNFTKAFPEYFKGEAGSANDPLVGSTPEIETLRPKSPPPRNNQKQ